MSNNDELNPHNLSVAEEFSDSLIDILPGTFSIINTDGKILKWNKKLEEVWGYSSQEISELTPFDFFEAKAKSIVAERIQAAFTTGHAELEEEIITKAGNKLYYLFSANAIKYKGQNCISVIGIDINEKRAYQTELKVREERYNAALNGIDAGVWDFDFTTNLLYLSPKYLQIIQREGEDNLTTLEKLATWMVPEDFAKSEAAFADYMAQKKPVFSLEVRFILPDQTIHWFSYSGKIMFDNNGTPIHMVGSLIDVHGRKLAEAKLAERKRWYKQALQGIGAGVWDFYDLEDGLINLSPRYLELIGREYEDRPYTQGEVKSWVFAEDLKTIQKTFEDNFRNKIANVSAEARYVFPSGFKRWFSYTATIIYNEAGAPTRIVGSIIDIHARKQAEERLTMSLKELSDYKIALDESSIVAITDQKGIINYVNDNFCRISKYSREELLGQDHRIINSGYHSKEFIRELWRTIANGKIWRGDLCNRAKDGSIYWVETTIVPFLTEEGKPWQYVAIRSDITERNKSASALRESIKELNDYKIALDESSIVAITDQKGIINYANDNSCRISKYTREELIGQDHRIINSGYHPKEFIRDLWRTIANGEIWRGDICNRAKDGSIYWVETTIVPFLTENGKPWQYVAIRSDITNRKLGEQETERMTLDLPQRNKDLEQFAYIVSHNLRAPVANILGFTDVLKQPGFSEDQKVEFVEKMSASVNKLDDVIRDLNHILQVKQEVSEIRETVKFSELVNDIEISIKNMINNEQVTFNTDFSEIDEIQTTKTYLYSIFYNLITDSIKYRQPGIPPVIEISSKKNNQNVVLTFKDNGMGIDLEKKGALVFGLYKRFHTHAAEGKGMGLYMAKTQVETIGGKINIDSKVNDGTIFTIELPI